MFVLPVSSPEKLREPKRKNYRTTALRWFFFVVRRNPLAGGCLITSLNKKTTDTKAAVPLRLKVFQEIPAQRYTSPACQSQTKTVYSPIPVSYPTKFPPKKHILLVIYAFLSVNFLLFLWNRCLQVHQILHRNRFRLYRLQIC